MGSASPPTADDQSGTTSSSSSSLDTSTLVMAAAVLLGTLYVLRHYHASRQYPPGPRGVPLLGYLDILWSADRRKLLSDLRKQYGDVLSLPVGCRLVVVVSGVDALRKVFVQQGSSFLHRPPVFAAVTHGGGGGGGGQGGKGAGSPTSTTTTSSSSSSSWQEHHEFTLNTLRPLTIGHHTFGDKIREELAAVCVLLDGTKGADFDPGHVLHTAAANIVIAVAFGKRFDYDDPGFVRFLASFEENMSLSAGSALEYFFPFLRYLPGDLLQRQKVLKNSEHVHSTLRTWVDSARRRYNPGDVGDLMDAYFREMEERKKDGKEAAGSFGYEQVQKLVADLLVSGTEFTATTLRWLLVFLVRWPHVQRKLRQEIDSVYPDKETPSAQDRRQMPYTEATLLECQRFADVCPFSLARAASDPGHVTMGEGGQQGHVPRGTLVVPNLRSLHYDPDLWGDPENFRPERFLAEEGSGEEEEEGGSGGGGGKGVVVVVKKPAHGLLPFSLGNRSCPAQELGQLQLFLFLVTLLQRYEIRPAGQGKLPSLDGHIGIAYAPYSYKVRFVRRDQPEEEEGEGENEGAREEGEGLNIN
ncbi:cytochrome P450 2J5-like [Babylonia areolata]|uniref:cytochrome P450 2J5-like n=1 Tax=Babylonia areolata TaxID=304850 RepID=UPI003FD5134B